MGVFVSFSDESTGKTERDNFVYGGWIGPEDDWSHFFTPAWDERVLAGPPRIPYFHMTEMRSREWREIKGLTEADAENRIDQGCVILDQLVNLHPVRLVVNAGDVRDEFHETRVVQSTRKQFASSTFEPDFICFLGYAWAALKYLAEHHPEAEKLDFVVERKNKVTSYIHDFHAQLPATLAAMGNPELARLVGELSPGGKDCLPLQAADLLCWHCARREKLDSMSDQDKRRYQTIAYRKGERIAVSKEMTRQMKSAALPPEDV
jgi:hypothetical protein